MTQLDIGPSRLQGEPPAEKPETCINPEELAELARLVLAANGVTVESEDNASVIQAAERKGHLIVRLDERDYFEVDPQILLDAFRLGRMMSAPPSQTEVY